jgi:fumarate hydratase subunit beta
VLKAPLSDETVTHLVCGDEVEIYGKIYTARDAAHKRMIEALDRGEGLPIDLRGQILYYVGPSPARPGMVIGSAGPTTSLRMDPYTPKLLELGLKAIIGKGYRSKPVRDALVQHKAVYLVATSGAGALLSKYIKAAKVVAYEDLGPEAIYELEVEAFPAIVINDVHGCDLYEKAQREFQQITVEEIR